VEGVDAAWWPSAAYLYVLHLDALALAWEYLRRNPQYRADWARRKLPPIIRPDVWGLRFFEDPALDARDAEVLWSPLPAACVRLTRAYEANTVTRFSLWKLPGRRSLFLENGNLWLTQRYGHHVRHAYLSPELSEDDPWGFLVPAGEDTLQHRKARSSFAGCLTGASTAPVPRVPDRPSSIGLFHMRALQALDADLAGAAHRNIAAALFGTETVQRDWHTDGYLRAQIRHMVRRAHSIMNGGYRNLAGI
jgi:hypothetical protein